MTDQELEALDRMRIEASEINHDNEIANAEQMLMAQESSQASVSLNERIVNQASLQGIQVHSNLDNLFSATNESVTYRNETEYVIIDNDPVIFSPIDMQEVSVKKRKKKPTVEKLPEPVKEDTPFVKKVREIVALSFKPEDFDMCKISGDEYGLMLRWPFLEMTNKYGKKHILKDMLVGLPFYYGRDLTRVNKFQGGIYGGRGTISLAEHVSRYRHSHLHTGSNSMSVFCTGVDDINVSWTDLKMSNVDSKNFEINFEAFLHQLTAFLRYESIEGTPYIKFGTVSLRNSRGYNSSDAARACQRYRNNFDRSVINLSMDFTAANVELVESDAFHSDLASHVGKHQKRLANGSYVDIDDSNSQSTTTGGIHISDSRYFFHGAKSIYVEPLELNIPEGDNFKKYAHNLIIDNVKQEIRNAGTRIIKEFCEAKRVRNKDEQEGSSSDWPIFDRRNTLLPIKTT